MPARKIRRKSRKRKAGGRFKKLIGRVRIGRVRAGRIQVGPIMHVALGALAVFGLATVVPVLVLRWLDPPTSAFMLQHGDLCSRVEQTWVDLSDVSPNVPLAVIVSEDQRFLKHSGFDFDSIANAARDRVLEGKSRGASSISQQTAKNLFLWPGKNFVRKGLEAWFTIVMEAFWPKRRILEVYLNVAQFGPCTFGVEAASWRFFGRGPKSLSRSEGALLAAVLPNPVRLKVDRPSAYVKGRVDWILEQENHVGHTRFLRGL